MRRAYILLLLVGWFLGSCAPGSANPPLRRIGFAKDAIAAHRIVGSERVRVPFDKLSTAATFSGIDVFVEIGPDGSVLRAEVDRDGNWGRADPAPALAAVRGWRFRPFEYRGAPVVAVGTVSVLYEGQGVWRQPDAPMPPIDYDQLSIVLERSACFGDCPDYRVEIKGDGQVVFTSRAEPIDPTAAVHRQWNAGGVLVPGRHVSRIDRAALDVLIARFRDAHFFGLKDEYQAGITDMPAYALTFRSGGRSKRVVDYVGQTVGMPAVVTALEEAVDRVAGTSRWVTGDKATVAALAAEGFDFSSSAAGALLLASMRSAPEELPLQLIARGVDLEASELPGGQKLGERLVEQSVLEHRPSVFAELERRGWLRRTPMQILVSAFADGGGGCSPAIAEALVRAGVSPAVRGREGKTALISALESYGCALEPGRDAAPIVSALIRLGVPLDPAAEDGDTALHKAGRFEVVRLLLAAGARADVRDKQGLSPAFSTWDDRAVLALLEAGADPNGRNSDRLTLRQTARRYHMPATLDWLDRHHIR